MRPDSLNKVRRIFEYNFVSFPSIASSLTISEIKEGNWFPDLEVGRTQNMSSKNIYDSTLANNSSPFHE